MTKATYNKKYLIGELLTVSEGEYMIILERNKADGKKA